MERINKNIRELLDRAGVATYNATQHASELDYLTELLSKAKLSGSLPKLSLDPPPPPFLHDPRARAYMCS